MLVLIVEDEPLVALEIEDAVTRAGHRPAGPASSYADAVAAASRERPDAATIDGRLADGPTGCRVAEHLGGIGVYCIAVSGNLEIFDDCDIDVLLAKPISDGDIEAALLRAEISIASERAAAARDL